MININNKPWEEISIGDIEILLSSADDETFFFEFKSDKVQNTKFIEEVSAFSNTYGGYVLLGIDDKKNIEGCTNWNEEKIHNTIHDSITPVPIFDVKKILSDKGTIYVVKIEEGIIPPYITSKGKIYERLSSGSYVIKDASKISQIYNKRENQLNRIKEKIELKPIDFGNASSNNIHGYIDFGFSLTTSSETTFQKNFFELDLSNVATYLGSNGSGYTISRLGDLLLFSVGTASAKDNNHKNIPIAAGLNNFIEILYDGSVRARILLYSRNGSEEVSVPLIIFSLSKFREIYKMLLGDESFSKKFICAHKYEKLTLLKQCKPVFDFLDDSITLEQFDQYQQSNNLKYGGNIIINSNRIPKNDYRIIDKRSILRFVDNYDNGSIMDSLFSSALSLLGFIDKFPKPESLEK